MSDTTKWLDGEPTIPGVYQRKFSFGAYYARWDGWQWYLSTTTAEWANRIKQKSRYGVSEAYWRGLKEKA